MVTLSWAFKTWPGFLLPVKAGLAGCFQHIQAGLALALDLQGTAGVRKADIMADVVVAAVQALPAGLEGFSGSGHDVAGQSGNCRDFACCCA
jgi:hypothetical protein